MAFHWSETDPFLGGVTPAALTEKLNPHRVAMLGTRNGEVRCGSLVGEVGVAAHCGIYQQRPSPCHALQPAWENGTASPQCDRARAAHGMPPLTPESWVYPADPGWTPLPRSA